MNTAIAHERLSNQGLFPPRHRRAADVVDWLGAVQAQEYEPAKWALGLRMADTDEAKIERAFEQGRILRTHVMRPTWHFVTPADIRWLQALTGPRIQRLMSGYHRQMALDNQMMVRGTAVIERALGDRQYLTRQELRERLRTAGLDLSGPRLAHVAMYAELEAVICSGPLRGKQFTYALVAERAPNAITLTRDEALAELGRRFLRSHGPATIRDLVWWSGLPTADARRALDIIKAKRIEDDDHLYWSIGPTRQDAKPDTQAHLLPIYDEYLVSYRDRVAVPHGPSVVASASAGSVIFQHAFIIAGQIAGTWRMARSAKAITITATPMRPLNTRERRTLTDAARRYESFVGVPVTLSIG